MSDVRIVILNYNGASLLKECLPSIVEASQASHFSCVVTVLDNQSQDQSEHVIQSLFPMVEWVKSPKNMVYCSFNKYFKNISESYVIILNNDIKVDSKFIDPLVDCLNQDSLCFMAAAQSKHPETGVYEGSLSKMEMRHGLIWGTSLFPGYENKIDKRHLTMQAGYGAFRREMILELGGFDEIYLPGTVEDTDLCFRAYRRGWKAFYCPESVVYHYGQASFKKVFGFSKIRRINRRNLYLFVWKNIRDPFLLVEHLFFIPLHILKYIFKGEWDFLFGLIDATFCFPKALKRRFETRQEHSFLTDREIFAYSGSI